MTARPRPLWPALLLALAGCVNDEAMQMVQPSPFGPAPEAPPLRRVAHAPATEEATRRVSQVGTKVLSANRQIAMHPAFLTIGAPAPEVFHRGTCELYVTEGLTRLCKTEEQLAAVLAVELGKMVAEREARTSPAVRRPWRLPPQDLHIGTESGGTFGPPDGTHLAELGKFEQAGGRPNAPLPPPPDPQVLAKIYLEKAGYGPRALDEAAPVLRAARANVALERQLTSPVPTVRPGVQ